mmetsp:Transcript_12242/g.26753  ORF Transcript_12242/g.26753 Transcript_12242/m.26753 type:complete len:153 (-) Transcript_12242:383-841(-)
MTNATTAAPSSGTATMRPNPSTPTAANPPDGDADAEEDGDDILRSSSSPSGGVPAVLAGLDVDNVSHHLPSLQHRRLHQIVSLTIRARRGRLALRHRIPSIPCPPPLGALPVGGVAFRLPDGHIVDGDNRRGRIRILDHVQESCRSASGRGN